MKKKYSLYKMFVCLQRYSRLEETNPSVSYILDLDVKGTLNKALMGVYFITQRSISRGAV